MKQLIIKPNVYSFDTCKEFIGEFKIGNVGCGSVHTMSYH